MKKIFILACIIICADLMIISNVYSYDLLQYFPIIPGASRQFSVKEYHADQLTESWQSKRVYEDYVSFNGMQTVPEASYDSYYFNMTLVDHRTFLTYDSDYIYLNGFEEIKYPPVGKYYFNPVIKFPRSMNIGESCTGTTTVTIPDGSTVPYYFVTLTLEAVEDVDVPAGKFSKCLKIRYSDSEYDYGDTTYWWWAKGIGQIKEYEYEIHDDEKQVQELTSYSIGSSPDGTLVTSDLWIAAMINTQEKGPVEAVWKLGGDAYTARGDRVIWGYFYASPSDVSWGSENNPEVFVKIWFDVNGRVDVNYFHVSVPDIEVYSDYNYDGTVDEYGTTTTSIRYIRQYYENGNSSSEQQVEDGYSPAGYSQTGNPYTYTVKSPIDIGAIINTQETGAIDAVFHKGGQDTDARGDEVVWGYFYADPSDVSWGSSDNPELFVKVWFDVSGRIDVNFFHVSVPDIEVYSENDSGLKQSGTTILSDRYTRHEY